MALAPTVFTSTALYGLHSRVRRTEWALPVVLKEYSNVSFYALSTAIQFKRRDRNGAKKIARID